MKIKPSQFSKGYAILAMLAVSASAGAQDQPVLIKAPIEPIPRVELRKPEQLPKLPSPPPDPTQQKITRIETADGWTDYSSKMTYPKLKGDRQAEWYVTTIARDYSSMSFVDKNAVERNGNTVAFDAWTFDVTPVKGNLFDSVVMTLEMNCKTLKGKLKKISLLRGNRVISEKNVDRDGFDPGTEGYAITQSACVGKFLMPMPAEPDAIGVRKVLESLQSERK